MKTPACTGLLIRLPAGAGAGAFGAGERQTLTIGKVKFQLEPLHDPATRMATQAGLAMSGGGEWGLARPETPEALQGQSPWDWAHAALGVTGNAYIEPDLVQAWPVQPHLGSERMTASKTGRGVFDDQDPKLPGWPEFAWHLADNFSGLRKAQEQAGAAEGKSEIRIVHLDTGYDPKHKILPKHLLPELERDFLSEQPKRRAIDPGVDGVMDNPGHGTGTLGILAGGMLTFRHPDYPLFEGLLGGAPEAQVVPVRVGESVVQIRTSAVARGIQYAAGLCGNAATRIQVISMSMGGLASQAWAEAVNAAYEQGIFFVAAAGNNYSAGQFGLPTRFIVYPARFRRVVAACGVMADFRPYYGLGVGTMQGNWGPASKMATAMAAFTPNTPWAEWGSPEIVDMNGCGTSSATPQVAAAAALYLQAHGRTLFDMNRYSEHWMRVEAVRNALFTAADRIAGSEGAEMFGNGVLRADAALGIAPLDPALLHKTPADGAAFPFLKVLTGMGVTLESDPRASMLELEATQLAQRWEQQDAPNPLELAIGDPDLPREAVSTQQIQRYLDGLSQHPTASKTLKEHAERTYAMMFGKRQVVVKNGGGGSKAPRETRSPDKVDRDKKNEVISGRSGGDGEGRRARRESATQDKTLAAGAGKSGMAKKFFPPHPPYRRLRGYGIDPSLSATLGKAKISEITFKTRWEKLEPGPVGEYLEVIDVDPASDCFYEPVNLNDPRLLAQDGLAPSEGTPQFHQQMTYAVSSLTIENFEHALGRKALWRSKPVPGKPNDDSIFVPRLRIYPHALRQQNAYYSPQKMALLFGYFNAVEDDPADHIPGARVFTALSHDIICHETTHALLDGMHRQFLLPSNPDVHAFHEAFADIVALFQHFTFPEILRYEIGRTQGDIRSHQNMLGEMAGQFGRSTGRRQALRDAIGRFNKETKKWEPHTIVPGQYEQTTECHERGSHLVAAVFDAFMTIYENRIADLLRLATGGTGILPPGAIPPDLTARLADEAARSAQHVLTMCIRALDYCPPTDITFGEYLRAILTADADLVADDEHNYRVAFVEAFRKRGIYPKALRVLSVESCLWRRPEQEETPPSRILENSLELLRDDAQEHAYLSTREQLFYQQRQMRRRLHDWLAEHLKNSRYGEQDACFLGIDRTKPFEVRTARFAYRVSPDGGLLPQMVAGLLQMRDVPGMSIPMEGGCTVLADLTSRKICYCIRKDASSPKREACQREFLGTHMGSPRAMYFGLGTVEEGGEPFHLMHNGS